MNNVILKYSLLLLGLILLTTLQGCQQDNGSRASLRAGNKDYKHGSFNAAESNYLKSTEQSLNMEALYGRANCKQRLSLSSPSDQIDKSDSVATESYLSALEHSSGNKMKDAKIYHNLGNMNYNSGLRHNKIQDYQTASVKFRSAVDFYKSSLRLTPEDDETRYNLAMAIYMIKKNEEEQQSQQSSQDNNSDNQQDQSKENQKDNEKEKGQNDKSDSKDRTNKQNSEDGNNKDTENDTNNKDDNKDRNNKDTNNKDNSQQADKGNDPHENSKSSSNPANQLPYDKNGKIDEKTANQLLNAAQQDENKVQKKLEKTMGSGIRYEKDW